MFNQVVARAATNLHLIPARSVGSVAPFGLKYGASGRSSNSGITATVFGAYGFVGRYLLDELGETINTSTSRFLYL